MSKKGNIVPETGPKEKHLWPQLVKGAGQGAKVRNVSGGAIVTPKGTKSQSIIRKEHDIKLSALRNKMK